MKELIIIETSQPQKIRKLLEQAHVDYKIYQKPVQEKSLFTYYNQVLKDKEWEKEAQELESAEEEDIIDEEW